MFWNGSIFFSENLRRPFCLFGTGLPCESGAEWGFSAAATLLALLVFCVGIRDLFLNPVGSSLKLWFLEIRLLWELIGGKEVETGGIELRTSGKSVCESRRLICRLNNCKVSLSPNQIRVLCFKKTDMWSAFASKLRSIKLSCTRANRSVTRLQT